MYLNPTLMKSTAEFSEKPVLLARSFRKEFACKLIRWEAEFSPGVVVGGMVELRSLFSFWLSPRGHSHFPGAVCFPQFVILFSISKPITLCQVLMVWISLISPTCLIFPSLSSFSCIWLTFFFFLFLLRVEVSVLDQPDVSCLHF